MTRYLLDLAFSLFLCIAAAVLWLAAGNFQTFGDNAPVGAAFWPKLILAAIFLLSLATLVRSVIAGLPPRETSPDGGPRIDVLRMAFVAALILGYFYALQYAGFLVSTVVFVGIAINLLPYQNRTLKLVFPVAVTAVMILLFAYGLSLPLPRGTGLFYDLNSIFY